MRRIIPLLTAIFLPLITHADPATVGLHRIQHVIVIYQENWSFDSLYGHFPGANGLANAGPTIPQVDKQGNLLKVLPQPLNEGQPDPHFPANLPVQPYALTNYITPDQKTGDLVHRFYHEQRQINGGKMDQFVTWSDNGGLVLSYFDATDMPEGKLARQYVMCDNFFHSAFGGSFLNHHFLIAAAAPPWRQPLPNKPKFVSEWDPATLKLVDGNLTTDGGYAVNTTYSINTPHPEVAANQLMKNINNNDPAAPGYTPTIGDRLNEKKISWKWYAGGWNNAVAGKAHALFQYHHQPFVYYANYADGTPGRKEHLADEKDFFSDLEHNKLPAVTFIKPLGPDNEHPGYADVARGQQHVADLVEAVQKSSAWKDSVIIITYDEHGGRWDHVPPPRIDQWGPGIRVPTIIISPFAKRQFVDHTQYETVSILKFIEKRFNLAPLADRDKNPAVNDLMNAFEF